MALILGSCGSSNSVVSNGLIQKRKYNKGFFLKSNGQFKTAKANTKEENTINSVEIAKNNFKAGEKEMLTNAVSVKKSVVPTPLKNDNLDETKNGQRNQIAEKNGEVTSRKSDQRFENFIEKNTQRGLRKVMREKAEKAKVAAASGSMSTGEIITLILIIVLIILAFTLLNSLTNGWLGWLIGLILTVVLIVLILRWLGII